MNSVSSTLSDPLANENNFHEFSNYNNKVDSETLNYRLRILRLTKHKHKYETHNREMHSRETQPNNNNMHLSLLVCKTFLHLP